MSGDLLQLSGPGGDVVIDVADRAILHWGPALGEGAVDGVVAALERPIAFGAADVVAPIGLVPEHGAGFPGRPGLAGRGPGGTGWAPRLSTVGVDHDHRSIAITADDVHNRVRLTTTMQLDDALRIRHTLTNQGDRRYAVERLAVTLPIPDHAAELIRFDGRWAREYAMTRVSWSTGAHVAENRRGRTSHEHPPLVAVAAPGTGEWTGDVWAAHLAWSGNHEWLADRLADGRRYLQLGELLHPGEIVLEPGESYRTPEVVAVHGDGLTSIARRFHRVFRSRSNHPTSPRPVLVNTWEALYFDHDHARLFELARRAAGVGVERFVLDDGWFGSRRDDTSGLGDWTVSPAVYPDGLQPLIDHVHELGMDFGIWVEPEMVSPDSDLARAHPDWALTTDGHEPILSRGQLVLDLTNDDAFHHVLGQLDSLLSASPIAFVKWDMNRDHIGAADGKDTAATHRQTLSVYRLIDELRRRHPGLEIESCSSGGARIDAEILRRTDRVWTSDCNDALERQYIQRGVSMLIPPELMGAHIGPERSHTTGRRHDLAFRGATALFGHLGIEWNLLDLDDAELERLGEVVALHRRFRPLLHGGDIARFDTGPDAIAHGVYARDRSEALVSFARVATSSSLTPDRLRLPDLDAATRYRVEPIPLPGGHAGPARRQPDWFVNGVALTGRQLAVVGLQPPAMHPDTAILLHLRASRRPVH